MSNVLKFRIADTSDIPVIRAIAEITWRPTYGHILTEEQTRYMLAMMYAEDALQKQLASQTFLLAIENNTVVGYAGFEVKEKSIMKLHKLYLLPQTQGKGYGKALIDQVASMAQAQGCSCLELNVNRHNKALGFYQKNGFVIVKEEDIAIGEGFWMNDYVMQKSLV